MVFGENLGGKLQSSFVRRKCLKTDPDGCFTYHNIKVSMVDFKFPSLSILPAFRFRGPVRIITLSLIDAVLLQEET